jgi:hypothetical protein
MSMESPHRGGGQMMHNFLLYLKAYKVWPVMLNKISNSIHPSFQFQILTKPDIVCHYFDILLIQVSATIFYDFGTPLTNMSVRISCGKVIQLLI